MLRITQVESSGSGQEMYLEGQLSGPWVAELQQLCEKTLGNNRKLRLDFSDVSFVDAEGVLLIRRLAAKHVRVENCTPFVAERLKKEVPEAV